MPVGVASALAIRVQPGRSEPSLHIDRADRRVRLVADHRYHRGRRRRRAELRWPRLEHLDGLQWALLKQRRALLHVRTTQ